MHCTYSDDYTHLRYRDLGEKFYIRYKHITGETDYVCGAFDEGECFNTIACFKLSDVEYVLVQQERRKKRAVRRYLWYLVKDDNDLELTRSYVGEPYRYRHSKVLYTDDWFVSSNEDSEGAYIVSVPARRPSNVSEHIVRVPYRSIDDMTVCTNSLNTVYIAGYNPTHGVSFLEVKLSSSHDPIFYAYPRILPIESSIDAEGRLYTLDRVSTLVSQDTRLIVSASIRSNTREENAIVFVYDSARQKVQKAVTTYTRKWPLKAYYDIDNEAFYVINPTHLQYISPHTRFEKELRHLLPREGVKDLVAIPTEEEPYLAWWIIDEEDIGHFRTHLL